METTTQHFTLGEPQVAGPLVVFPVFGSEPRLEYRAFAQATNLGACVKELDGGASVNDLVVHNPTGLPLLVYEGEEVQGAQQNRTFDASVLVAAGKQATLNVSCVEEGRWDARRHGEPLRPSPQAADPSLRRLKRQTANVRAAEGGPVRANQTQVWDDVRAKLADNAVESSSGALSDLFDVRRDSLTGLVDPVAHREGQLGAVAQVGGRPVALDLVSRPDVFAVLLPRLAQGYALDASGTAEAEPDHEAAEQLLREGLDASRSTQPTPGMGWAFGLETPAIVGSGLEADDELVQLCAFPRGETRRETLRGPRITRPSVRRRRTA